MGEDFTDDLEQFDSIFGDLDLTPDDTPQLLFVYGTMRREERNHYRLRGTTYMGMHRTTSSRYALNTKNTQTGVAPIAVPGKYRIGGELYEVPMSLLREIDIYEGHPDVYTRSRILLNSVNMAASIETATEAWAYLYQHPVKNPLVNGILTGGIGGVWWWSSKHCSYRSERPMPKWHL